MMSRSKRILASALLALVLIVSVVLPTAAATHFTVCFTFQGKEYCIEIPLEYNITFKIPPDKPNEATDILVVVDAVTQVYRANPEPDPWLKAFVENPDQQWFLMDATGKHVVLLDKATKAAIEVEAEVGY